FFQAEDGIRYYKVTGVQTCALPIYDPHLLPAAPEVLNALGRYEEVVAGYPQPASLVAQALYRMGRFDEVATRFACFTRICSHARSEERRVGKECRSRWAAEGVKSEW